MTAPDIFKVTPAYSDSAQNAKDKTAIQTDAWLSIDLVHMGHYEQAQAILLDWALHCREVYGSKKWFRLLPNESSLVMTFKGVSFLESFLLMKDMERYFINFAAWNKEVFPPWVETVYRPCAYGEQRRGENNRGSWGILGCVLSDMILGRDLSPWIDRVDRNHKAAFDSNGKSLIEIHRTNMGIWYFTFTLSAMLRTCQLLNHPRTDNLIKPLTWLWQYIQDPDSWPYRPGQGLWSLFPKLENIIHPTTSTLDRPRPNDEAGALYLAAGKQFGNQEWIDYAQPWPNDPPFPGVNEFRWVRK